MSVNKVILVGNVGADPEVRYLDGNGQNGQGTKVASFRLATSERYRDRNGEQRENTEWHSIVAWRQSADVAERFIKKGTQVYIEGKLRTRTWTDQSGAKRSTTEVMVDTLQLLGRREDGGAPQGGYATPAPGYQQPAAPSYQQPAHTPAAPAAPPAAPEGFDIGIQAPTDDLPF